MLNAGFKIGSLRGNRQTGLGYGLKKLPTPNYDLLTRETLKPDPRLEANPKLGVSPIGGTIYQLIQRQFRSKNTTFGYIL